MTRYPVEASEIQRYTPESLANLPSPPVFLIKPATRREKRLHQRLILESGLSRHTDASIREEMIRGLAELWSPDQFAEYEPRIRDYWNALDQWLARVAKLPPEERIKEVFEHPDQVAVDEVISRIYKIWQPLLVMVADNIEFREQAPMLTLSCMLTGWEHVGTPFVLTGNFVPLDTIEDIADWLGKLEADHQDIEGVQASGTAFAQLTLETGKALMLSEEERKNFDSPSPTPSSQDSSIGEEATASSSKELATPDTPAN